MEIEWLVFGSLTQMDVPIITPPFGRVAMLGINILQRDREMDQKQVKVLNAPEVELVFGHRFSVLVSMESIPELSCIWSGSVKTVAFHYTLDVIPCKSV